MKPGTDIATHQRRRGRVRARSWPRTRPSTTTRRPSARTPTAPAPPASSAWAATPVAKLTINLQQGCRPRPGSRTGCATQLKARRRKSASYTVTTGSGAGPEQHGLRAGRDRPEARGYRQVSAPWWTSSRPCPTWSMSPAMPPKRSLKSACRWIRPRRCSTAARRSRSPRRCAACSRSQKVTPDHHRQPDLRRAGRLRPGHASTAWSSIQQASRSARSIRCRCREVAAVDNATRPGLHHPGEPATRGHDQRHDHRPRARTACYRRRRRSSTICRRRPAWREDRIGGVVAAADRELQPAGHCAGHRHWPGLHGHGADLRLAVHPVHHHVLAAAGRHRLVPRALLSPAGPSVSAP